MQDYTTDDEKTHFSFTNDDLFVVTYWDEGNPWWTAYPLRYPNGTQRRTIHHRTTRCCHRCCHRVDLQSTL